MSDWMIEPEAYSEDWEEYQRTRREEAEAEAEADWEAIQADAEDEMEWPDQMDI